MVDETNDADEEDSVEVKVGGATRTMGFWKTHLKLSHAVWFSGTVGGHTFTGVVDKTIGTKLIDEMAS